MASSRVVSLGVVEAFTVVSVQLIEEGSVDRAPSVEADRLLHFNMTEPHPIAARWTAFGLGRESASFPAIEEPRSRRAGAGSRGRCTPAARAADGAPRRGEEGAEQGAAAAGSAQRLLHFNMAEPRSKVNPGSPLGQPWVPDFWRASVGPAEN